MSKPITVSIVGNAGPLKKSLGDADKALGKFGDSMKKFGMVAAAGVGALAAGIGVAAKAAAQDQKAFEQLSNTIRNVTGATHEQIKAVDDQIDTMQRATGIADDKLRPAFEALVRGTRDVDVAMSQMNLVVDISTSLQMDAATVADALAKAQAGNTKALKSLSPEMAAMIKEGASMNEILEVLTANFEGSAAAAANTFEGRMARLQIAFGEIVEQIGYVFLPILERVAAFMVDRVVPIVQELADAFSEGGLSGVIKVASGNFLDFYDNASTTTKTVISATVAIGAMFAAMKTLTFIQTVAGLMDAFTASVGRSTVAVAGFQATALAAFSVIAAVAGTALLAIDTMFKDGGYYGRAFFRSIADFVNITIGAIELLVNSFNTMINNLIYGINLINPLKDIPYVPSARLPRVPTQFGSGSTTPNTAPSAGRFDPDFPKVAPPAVPVPAPVTIPTPELPKAAGGGGGGVGGETRRPERMEGSGSFGAIDASFSGDLFDITRLAQFDATGAPINIVVNAGLGTDGAKVGEEIVGALREFTRDNGPIGNYVDLGSASSALPV